jgi:hypothetical protein
VNPELWRAQGDFVVNRRVPWDTDEGLRPHIDRVVDDLRDCDSAAEIEVDADLASARVLLSVTIVVTHDDEGQIGDADGIAREAIGTAIRANGGRHEELLPILDEARLETRGGRWSGLRIPRWTLYQLVCHPVVAD